MSRIINLIATLGATALTGYFLYKVVLPGLKDVQLPTLQFPDFSQFQFPQQQQQQQQPQPVSNQLPLPEPIQEQQQQDEEEDETPTRGGGTTGGITSGPGTLTTPTATGAGVTDGNGIKWLYADGDITIIKQSRTDSGDHRWSGNVSGLGKLGMEATMIVDFTSASVKSGGHFAMKHGGPNHSGSGSSSGKWYDTGIRSNGAIQVQTEHPHPNNHTYSCSDVGGCSVSSIGKPMQGSIIGLKWVLQPSGNGNFIALYYDANALTGGRPTNAWKKVFSIVDTKLLPGWKPPDTQDCEIRISDTDGEKAYAGGLHVRKFTKPISQGTASFVRALFSKTTIARPNYFNSRYPPPLLNTTSQRRYQMLTEPYLYNGYYNRRRL